MTAETKKSKKKRIKILVLLIAVFAIFDAAFALSYVDAPFKDSAPFRAVFQPEMVENVDADVTYGGVTLTWDPAKRAEGYEIYDEVDGEKEIRGITIGECKFTDKEYDREKHHSYSVVAFRDPMIINHEYRAEASDPVMAFYDSSKYAQKIPILSYHQVLPEGSENNSISIPVDKFEEQMKYLHDEGFVTMTLDEFRSWYEGKEEFPVKSCVITFDDGFSAMYYLVYPIIREYDQAATVFCIGNKIGEETDKYDPEAKHNSYLGMDIIEKVRREYPRFAFESHSYNMHNKINNEKPVNIYSYDEMIEDCKNNREYGFKYMAYPWGNSNEKMKRALKATGYKMAFEYRPFYYATRDNDRYAIDRVKIDGRKDLDRFIQIVNGEVSKYDR